MKALVLLQQMQRLKDNLETTTRESVKQERRASVAELELATAMQKNTEMLSEIASLNLEIENLRRFANEMSSSRSDLSASADQLSRVMIDGLSSLDSFVADTVARANTGLIGRLISRPNGEPTTISIVIPEVLPQAILVAMNTEKQLSVDFGITGLFSASVKIVEGAMQSFSRALEAVLADVTLKATGMDSLELLLRDSERSWINERTGYHDEILSLKTELSSVIDSRNRTEMDLQNSEREIDKLRLLLREYSTQREELESEYRIALDNINNLQDAFAEAESVCLELQTRIRSTNTELTAKSDELKLVSEHVELSQRRANNAESMLQKVRTDCERFRSERDSISTVRRTLELELERTRIELSAAVTQAQNRLIVEEEAKAKFALEKLLSSLGSTLDQISTNFSTAAATANNISNLNLSGIELDHSSTALVTAQQNGLFSPIAHKLRGGTGAGSASLIGDSSFVSTDGSIIQEHPDPSWRVDLAVKRLTELRTWSREESRQRRSLLEKIEILTLELNRIKKVSDETSTELRLSISKEMEKTAELKERCREIADLRDNMLKNHDDLDRQKKEYAALLLSFEEEKRLRSKLLVEMQTKDSEMRKLTLKWEHSEASLVSTHDELTASRQRLTELTTEYESCAELLKATKANNARLSSSLGLLEKGVEKDLSDRGLLQQRLTEVQGTASESIRLRHHVTELDATVTQLRLQLRQYTLNCDTLEDASKKLTHDNEMLKRKTSSLELRLEQALKERFDLQQENNELRLEAAKANHQYEIESAAKTKAEVALAALAKDGRGRHNAEDYSALVEEVEGKFYVDEEEKNILRHSNHTLKLALDEKDTQRHGDQLKISKLEKELALLKSKVSKSTVELLEANNKASTLRSQGRKARTQVLDIVAELRSLLELVRASAPSVLGTGVDLTFLLETGKIAVITYNTIQCMCVLL